MKSLWPVDLFICPNCAQEMLKAKHTLNTLSGLMEGGPEILCPLPPPDWNS